MINNIVREDRCCGCSACFNICPKNAITMVENSTGFLIPEINNELCINCSMCDKSCPANTKSNKSLLKCYTLKIADDAELVKRKVCVVSRNQETYEVCLCVTFNKKVAYIQIQYVGKEKVSVEIIAEREINYLVRLYPKTLFCIRF